MSWDGRGMTYAVQTAMGRLELPNYVTFTGSGGTVNSFYALDTPLSPDETADLEREEEPAEPLEGPGRVRPVYEDDAELGGEG